MPQPNAAQSETESTSSMGALIKDRRLHLGLSKRNIAQGIYARSGIYIDTDYLSQLEQGRIKLPRQPYFSQLAQELELSEISLLRSAGYITEDASPGNPFSESDPRHTIVEMLSRVDESGAIHIKRVIQGYIEQSSQDAQENT